MQNTQEKANLQKTKVNATKIRKVHVDGNKPYTRKERGQTPSSLDCRLIVVVRQADKMFAVYKIFEI